MTDAGTGSPPSLYVTIGTSADGDLANTIRTVLDGD
ncbi:hypothetical protein SAMN06295888_101263 [Desulfonatronum zhilinae]|nr:hypothetical protein SAMN06295888_101263 [Desulfonatronum zhilinae]